MHGPLSPNSLTTTSLVLRRFNVTKRKTLGALLALALCGAMALSVTVPAVTRATASEDRELSNIYNSEFDERADLSAAASSLGHDIVAEGAVMLKNADNALPLQSGAKISIFGKNSTKYSYASALSSAGFKVNNTLINFYSDNTKSGPGSSTIPQGFDFLTGYEIGETPQSMYTEDVKQSFSDYSDAAIVVIWRNAHEGWDDPRTMRWDPSQERPFSKWTDKLEKVNGARNEDDHYLQLDQNETDLIKMCGENFDKVIVVFNTPSSFETGFLDDPGHYAYHENVKAAFYLGWPSTVTPFAEILKGEINPSGRLTDTWARDFKLDPTWQNFNDYMAEPPLADKGNAYVNLRHYLSDGSVDVWTDDANYVTYNEGIYVGYRYWETRGFTEGNSAYTSSSEQEKASYIDELSGGSKGNKTDYIHGSETTSWDDWYSAHVVYPFGHGLSYTTFSWEIETAEPVGNSELSEDGTITIKVKVKNTGSVAGKDVVELYYTAPYKEGQIEKSHVVLAAFEKTKLLEPQEEQTVTLSLKVRDMASYDYSDANHNSFKGYELDAGTYTIRLMKNSHDEVANVTYNLSEGVKYETSEETGYKIENQFDEVTNYITNDLQQKYLSRNNWEETWPKFNIRLTAPEWVREGLQEWKVRNNIPNRPPEADKDEPYYTEDMPTTGVQSGIILKDLHGLDYDDPLWDQYLDQFTVEQLTELTMDGYYGSGQDYPELGVRRMGNMDGPEGLGHIPGSGSTLPHYGYSSSIVLGSTWNKALAYRFGKMVGEDALWSGGENFGGWYGPAVNIHRSQFAGRNWQYFSEDGYLAGMIAANEVKGAQEKGLPVYVKHFALNNQENDRHGVMTWANEQCMREIYFRPFEIAVKEGKALGLMSSFNRIGVTWAGGCYELLTEVLRNEWGFHGCVVTDAIGDNLAKGDEIIRAGGNLGLAVLHLKYNVGTPTTVSLLREAAKGLLYAQAHSNAMNDYAIGYHPIENFPGGILERGTVGVPYSQNIANAKLNDVLYPNLDDSLITYKENPDSKLPAGLSVSEDGMLTGTPTEECNNYRFKVDATYANYTKTATFTISIVGANGAIVYEAEQDLGSILVDKTADLSVAGATVVKPELDPGEVLPDCTYSLANGSKLPTGLVLSSDGKITGKPTGLAENYTFSVTASAKGYASVTLPFKLNIYRTMTFETAELANGKLGVSYLQKLPAAVTEGEVTYALKSESKLPNGLELTAGGYIVGIPRETVTDQAFTVVATSPYTEPVEREFKITIGLSFNANRLASGKVGESYRARVDTAQGAGEIKYTLAEGSVLPEGLTLSEDGLLTGTPTKAGVYKLIVLASAEGKEGDTITLTLYIEEASTASGGSEIDPPVEADNGCGSFIGPAGAGVFLIGLGAVCSILLAGKHSRRKEDSTGADEQKD